MFGFIKSDSSDMAAKLAALDKSQAVIEFDLDGTIITANGNFLGAMGYDLSEIKGQHHRMFVDPNYGASQEYRQFWERLRAGEFQAAQFKRFAKGGREIWIEASYNPILDRHGKPYKVVKFATDVTKAKAEYADLFGQVQAIRKSQAVIEFTLDGTIVDANDNFLNAVGYTLAEIKGKHHRMFVDPSYGASQDYRDFWDRLRAGEYQAAQYKRFGKGGKEIWIEASYNPIRDLNGRPFKVVKYASDITKQMALLASLKVLIDRNFGEIDQAINMTSNQAKTATEAASGTSANVQTVASSAEELAASVAEISQSMTRSRAATDDAFGETDKASQATKRLADAAQAMSGIVELIQSIAGQINLLALNATIESARAGDAGKGFAVVAQEVKNLANQAANATKQISQEIEGIQVVSTDVVGALETIRSSIEKVKEYVTATASAVEEQSAVTQNLSSNMQTASASVESITKSISEISAAAVQAGQSVKRTKEAAQVLAR